MSRADDNLDEMLASQDKFISRAKDAPAKLYRTVLSNFSITGSVFVKMLNNYLIDPRNGIAPDKRMITKGNLARALRKRYMSWKKLEQGLRIVGTTKYELHLVLYRGSERTVHRVDVYLGEQTYSNEQSPQHCRIEPTLNYSDLLLLDTSED